MAEDKRLIEDFLPIQAISAEASREKSVRKGHISTLHLWWARRPLVACRAAVYGALVPASKFVPENGPDNKKQSLGRANAAKFIERLCKYPGNPSVIKEAQEHILEAHAERLTRETGKKVTAEDIKEGRAPRPKVLDMFAGGGAIPLEALRLGCDAYALDLNPVAHIIELCTLVYPQKYGKPDPNVRGMTGPKNAKAETTWGGLAKEVEYWGKWVLKEVRREIGDLYPPIPDPDFKGKQPEVEFRDGQWVAKIPQRDSPTLNLAGEQHDRAADGPPLGHLTPVAYLWTRTVVCKNPSCAATVPLVRQTWLRKHPGDYVALRLQPDPATRLATFDLVESTHEDGLGFDPNIGGRGGNVVCPFCHTTQDSAYVMSQGVANSLGTQLMATACTRIGSQRKVFSTECPAVIKHALKEAVERLHSMESVEPWTLFTEEISPSRPSPNARGLTAVTRHGIDTFGDLFCTRQRLALLVFVSAIKKVTSQISTTWDNPERHRAIVACLALALSRVTDFMTTLGAWLPNWSFVSHVFARHAASMSWDFGELVPIERMVGSWPNILSGLVDALSERNEPISAFVKRADARALPFECDSFDAIVTDPPYYDNIPYADVSDFFYVWLKRLLGDTFQEHFSAHLTPKKAEITALAARFGGDMTAATQGYEDMMFAALSEARRILKPYGCLTMVYAHKTTLGWATLVDALRRAGFVVSEAWPLATEMRTRAIAMNASALASSIFLVARKRNGTGDGSYERDVRPELESIVRERVDSLWKMGITGADLVIAAVGAGLRAFTRFSRVEYANGEEVPAERFLAEVEGVVLETLLEKIFGVSGSGVAAVDGPSRFYVLWRYTYKAAEMDAGEAIVFTYGQNVELDGQNGLSSGARALVEKKKGKYRLLDFTERGDDEKLGMPKDDGAAAPLIDALHRILWLVENEPRNLNRFLDEARPDRERLRLVAQALAGTALSGSKDDGPEHAVATTPAEQAALRKLVANWRPLIEQRLAASDGTLFQLPEVNR